MEHMFIASTADLVGSHRSDYHLVLPQLYSDQRYFSYYKSLSSAEFLMQDNGIFELGCSVGELVDAAKSIGAHEIMVPEVLRDAKGCLEATEDFFSRYPLRSWGSYAACLQGKSWEEIEMHYRELVRRFPQVTTICIPYGLEFDCHNDVTEEGLHSGWNRFSNILALVKRGAWNVQKTHHLLGLHNPAELAAYGRAVQRGILSEDVLSSIRSNDSSLCYKYGLYGCRLSVDSGFIYPKKIKGKLDHEARYTNPLQWETYEHNVKVINLLVRGMGGYDVTADYFEHIDYREGTPRRRRKEE
jgi:hypothetical protein